MTAIEELQPYKGVDWTARLRDISNPDKHRKLVTLLSSIDSTIRVMRVDGPEGSDVRTQIGPSGLHGRPRVVNGSTKVHVDLDLTAQITLEDGAPVMETLQVLQSEVGAAVQAFEAEFK